MSFAEKKRFLIFVFLKGLKIIKIIVKLLNQMLYVLIIMLTQYILKKKFKFLFRVEWIQKFYLQIKKI
mgnify:CR=1 FL=1